MADLGSLTIKVNPSDQQALTAIFGNITELLKVGSFPGVHSRLVADAIRFLEAFKVDIENTPGSQT